MKAAEAKRKAAEGAEAKQLAEDRERWKAAEAKRKAEEAAHNGNGGNGNNRADNGRNGAGNQGNGNSNRDLSGARAAWSRAIERKVKSNWHKPTERFGMAGTARLTFCKRPVTSAALHCLVIMPVPQLFVIR